MDLSKLARSFKKALSGRRRIVVISHQRPDGDAVGCSLAMGLALRKMGKTAEVWNEDPLPEKFQFLPGGRGWKMTPPAVSRAFDAVISVDNANKKRLGRAVELLHDTPVWINIDHHASNERFGGLNIVDSSSPATGEVLYRLFRHLRVKVDKAMATSLFVAISTDTGSFNYPATTAACLHTAAELVGCGLNVGEISRRVYESHPLRRFLLVKRFLQKTRFRSGSRISYSWITPEDYAESGAKPEDSEGLIDMIRAIDTVVASVLFEQLPDGKVRLSLRSKQPTVDVNQVAQLFGGGGHRLAAGARTKGSPRDIEEKVLKELEKRL